MLKEIATLPGAGEKRLPPNPLMRGMAGGEYVRSAVASVRPGELEAALLCLPFADALRLLPRLASWLACGVQVKMLNTCAQASASTWLHRECVHTCSWHTDHIDLAPGVHAAQECGGSRQVELGCRVAVLLVRLHRQQLLATPTARRPLLALHARLHDQVPHGMHG